MNCELCEEQEATHEQYCELCAEKLWEINQSALVGYNYNDELTHRMRQAQKVK